MKAAIIIALAIGIAIQAVPGYQQAPNPKDVKNQTRAHTSPPPKEVKPALGKPQISIEHQAATYKYHYGWRDVFYPQTLSNWALVVVGFLGVIAAMKSLRIISRQTDIMERQAGIAETSAEAARTTAEASKAQSEAIITGDRAWIFVETGNIPDDFEPDVGNLGFLDVKPVVRNAGKTPGWITKGFVCSHLVESGKTLPPEPNCSGGMTSGAPEGGVNIVLPPNAVAQPLHVKIRLSDFIAVRRGTKKLYVYGFIDYTDFANNPRQSRFCFTYHVPTGFDSLRRGFYLATNVPTAYTRCT